MTASIAPSAVEVVTRLGPTIVDVRLLDRRRATFRIGEGRGADATVAVAGAGPDGCATLVALRGGVARVTVPAGATGELRRDGERAELAAGATIELVAGACAIVQVGPLSFEVAATTAEPAPRFRPVIEWPLWLGQGASLALFLTLVALVQMTAREATPPRWDDPELQERLIGYVAGLRQQEPEPAPRPFASDLRPDAGTPAKQAEAPRERPREQPTAEEPVGGATIAAGPRGQDAQDMAKGAGIFGVAGFDRALKKFTAGLPDSIKHYADTAADREAWTAAARSLPRAAVAGLELLATERGGGGQARDVVDLPVTLLAKVDKSGKRRWAGHGRAESAFAEKAVPDVREAPRQDTEWTASIGHDLIRGVVRRHTPEVRRCVRERDPSLSGKLEVAFTIGEGGKVEQVSVPSSSIADREVIRCVTETVKAWTFPTIVAAAGDVAVRYPFSVG